MTFERWTKSFRLLTELYSFLQVDYIYPLFWLGWYGFRLLTELYSFLHSVF